MGTRRLRFLGGLVMALGLLTVAPPAVGAAGSYSLDGGDPSTCGGTYVTWASRTMTPASTTGYIKVELMYCPANQVVWTRSYNYTNHNPAWLATGIERSSTYTPSNKTEDYVKRTCDTFCLDSLGYGKRGYGRQLWIPSNFSGSYAGRFTASVYYCYSTASNCSSHATLSVSSPSVGSRIAALALTKLGGTWSQCGDFVLWAWRNADPGVIFTGLSNAPATFPGYSSSSTPHVGDAVVFDSLASQYYTGQVGAHVAIVYRVNSDGTVDSVGGNEDGGLVSTRHFYAAPGSTAGTLMGQTLKVNTYTSPKLW